MFRFCSRLRFLSICLLLYIFVSCNLFCLSRNSTRFNHFFRDNWEKLNMKKRPTNDDSDEFDVDEPEEFDESGSDWDPDLDEVWIFFKIKIPV